MTSLPVSAADGGRPRTSSGSTAATPSGIARLLVQEGRRATSWTRPAYLAVDSACRVALEQADLVYDGNPARALSRASGPPRASGRCPTGTPETRLRATERVVAWLAALPEERGAPPLLGVLAARDGNFSSGCAAGSGAENSRATASGRSTPPPLCGDAHGWKNGKPRRVTVLPVPERVPKVTLDSDSVRTELARDRFQRRITRALASGLPARAPAVRPAWPGPGGGRRSRARPARDPRAGIVVGEVGRVLAGDAAGVLTSILLWTAGGAILWSSLGPRPCARHRPVRGLDSGGTRVPAAVSAPRPLRAGLARRCSPSRLPLRVHAAGRADPGLGPRPGRRRPGCAHRGRLMPAAFRFPAPRPAAVLFLTFLAYACSRRSGRASGRAIPATSRSTSAWPWRSATS